MATSRHLPGVRFTGITHPGLFGTAPSAELLERWNRREQALIDTDPDRIPPLGLAPDPDQALAGKATGSEAESIGQEGAGSDSIRPPGGPRGRWPGRVLGAGRRRGPAAPGRCGGTRRRGPARPGPPP
ncbi:formamidase [Streptomyces viridosporus ATCC 14672]|uniref:Formamidase n=1 Tax=Streptomyces viridosporus (strain ATCC 14672 / DSM 40746 / JCM 4963 / KCTC 9882 / NRRL B-12104 / FH 1290) TaxID=566461 RepID=D5ZTY1_STRV1|nr:formamidase [Streptomyces viridosporus ATCC 14672]